MRKYFKPLLLLLFVLFLFPSCRTITRKSEDIGIILSTVFFSFDDGPNARDDTTERVLDILKKYEIRGMFSLLGKNAEAHPELVRRIHDEGHIIINHGYSDKWARDMGRREFRNNLAMGEAAITNALGKELSPKLYRPHGGLYKPWQEKICIKNGYTIALSSARAYDAVLDESGSGKTVSRIVKKIEKNNGGVILLHDARDTYIRMEKHLKKNPGGPFNRSWIPDALEEIIITLLEKGYNVTGRLP